MDPSLNKDKLSLPYVERFRPRVLDDIVSHEEIIKTLKSYIDYTSNIDYTKSTRIPHLLFYGPPGTGKTSTIESFLNELYGSHNNDNMVMSINASAERGIDVVRCKISPFVNTKPISSGDPRHIKYPKFKFVILDEADQITNEAQAMLRIVMERNTKYARFCLICNCINKIKLAIQSRCKVFKFKPLDEVSISRRINTVSKLNKITVTADGSNILWKISKGDVRKIMHNLQVLSISHKTIDSIVVSKFMKYPSNKDIDKLYKTLTTDNLKNSIDLLSTYISEYSYSMRDILTELSNKILLEHETLNLKQIVYIDKNLREIEMNLTITSETSRQLACIASAFVIMRNMS